jgi:hypothetical protein
MDNGRAMHQHDEHGFGRRGAQASGRFPRWLVIVGLSGAMIGLLTKRWLTM